MRLIAAMMPSESDGYSETAVAWLKPRSTKIVNISACSRSSLEKISAGRPSDQNPPPPPPPKPPPEPPPPPKPEPPDELRGAEAITWPARADIISRLFTNPSAHNGAP